MLNLLVMVVQSHLNKINSQKKLEQQDLLILKLFLLALVQSHLTFHLLDLVVQLKLHSMQLEMRSLELLIEFVTSSLLMDVLVTQ